WPRRCAASTSRASRSGCAPACARSTTARCGRSTSTRSQVRLDDLQQRALRLGADDLLDDLAVLVEQQRRQAHHAVLVRRLGVGAVVQLRDLDLAGLLLGDLVEHGRDHAARAAPVGPEVAERRGVAVQDLALEGRGGHGDRGRHGPSFVGCVPRTSSLAGCSFPGPGTVRPSSSAMPALTRSAAVSSTRDASATTTGAPAGSAGVSTTVSAASRAPIPPGAMKTRNPATNASAYAPVARNGRPAPSPPTAVHSSHVCTPNRAQPRTVQPTARSVTARLTGRSSGGRRITLSISPSDHVTILGCRRASRTGASRN